MTRNVPERNLLLDRARAEDGTGTIEVLGALPDVRRARPRD